MFSLVTKARWYCHFEIYVDLVINIKGKGGDEKAVPQHQVCTLERLGEGCFVGLSFLTPEKDVCMFTNEHHVICCPCNVFLFKIVTQTVFKCSVSS